MGYFWGVEGGYFLGILGFGVGLGHGRGVVVMMRYKNAPSFV